MGTADNAAEPATLPLDAWHRAQGGRMVSFAGYAMPVQYAGEHGGIIAESEWTRSSASLFDVSHMGQLVLTGSGAAEWLETVLPGAFVSLKPHNMRYSLLLNEDGGTIDDLMVTNTSTDAGESFYIVVNGATKQGDIAHLRQHLPASLTLDHLEEQALIALQGPTAAEALEMVLPGVADQLYFMQGTGLEWRGVMVGVGRSGYTGEDGFEITLPASHAQELAEALVADERVRPAGLGARDALRLEAGLPLYGHELSAEIDPVSAGLTFAIPKRRREEGGFIGHAAIMRRLTEMPPRLRVGLALEGRLPAREESPVLSGESPVGTVTSGGFSPTLGHPIAIAMVDAAHAEEGTALEIEVRGKRLPARIVPMPFVPHHYHRKGA